MKSIYKDEYGHLYVHSKDLASGGQGKVILTDSDEILIKLALKKDKEEYKDEKEIKNFLNKINDLILLPLPQNLKLARPLSLLDGKAGYTMRFLDEMYPIGSFLNQRKAINHNFIEQIKDDKFKNILNSYLVSGGLKRALLILSKCASILARIHNNGFVYGDISLNNIFISANPEFSEVWLIDADNICWEKNSKNSMHTPRFEALELINGSSKITIKTDEFAFAILVYKLLTLEYPITHFVEEENWDGTPNTDQPNHPWIDHPNNPKCLYQRFDLDLVLNKKLYMLFNHCFDEGYYNTQARPSCAQWAMELAVAHDRTIVCEFCKMSYYVENDSRTCPYCQNAKPLILQCASHRWLGDAEAPIFHWLLFHEIHQQNDYVIKLPQRLFEGFSMTNHHDPIIKLHFSKNSDFFLIEKVDTKIDLYLYLPSKITSKKFDKITSQYYKIDGFHSFYILYKSELNMKMIEISFNHKGTINEN